MGLKHFHPLTLLKTGIIWIPLYTFVMSVFGKLVFNFSPISQKDWNDKITAFQKDWVINTGYDWAFVIYLLLFIPLMLIGWRIFCKIKWKKVFSHKSEYRVPKQAVQAATAKKVFEPQKMRVQSSALLSTPMAPAAPTESGPSNTYTAVENAPVPNKPTEQYEDEAAVQQALALTAGIQADFFPHVNLEGAYASFALSTEKRAAVFCIINRPESTWAVDIDVDITESDWFYESGILKAPAKDILSIAKNLQQAEPDSIAIPVILLMGGTLLNQEETMAYFEKYQIVLLRTDTVMADSVPLFTDFLSEYFASETETENHETQNT